MLSENSPTNNQLYLFEVTMKKALLSLTIGLGLLTSMPAEAAYGPAGCGLGAQFVDKDGDATGIKGLITVFVNGLFMNQAISISFKLGNCNPDGAGIDTYIEDNATQLAFDFSQGEGESVSTLANMLECEESNLIEYGQSNYDALFTSSDALSSELQAYAANSCGNL